jgi:hypothetical protein
VLQHLYLFCCVCWKWSALALALVSVHCLSVQFVEKMKCFSIWWIFWCVFTWRAMGRMARRKWSCPPGGTARKNSPWAVPWAASQARAQGRHGLVGTVARQGTTPCRAGTARWPSMPILLWHDLDGRRVSCWPTSEMLQLLGLAVVQNDRWGQGTRCILPPPHFASLSQLSTAAPQSALARHDHSVHHATTTLAPSGEDRRWLAGWDIVSRGRPKASPQEDLYVANARVQVFQMF